MAAKNLYESKYSMLFVPSLYQWSSSSLTNKNNSIKFISKWYYEIIGSQSFQLLMPWPMAEKMIRPNCFHYSVICSFAELFQCSRYLTDYNAWSWNNDLEQSKDSEKLYLPKYNNKKIFWNIFKYVSPHILYIVTYFLLIMYLK